MSDDTKEPGTDLVDYEALLAGMAKQATASERPSTSSITCRAGVLKYNGEAVPGNKLDAIIIASTHVNLYYGEEYDPDDPKNPDCFAYSEDGEDMKPHPAVLNPIHDNCQTCPMNQWRSDPKGGKGKACKNSRRLAIIPADTKPEEVINAEVATLNLPVMSVKGWGIYVNKLATLYSRPPLGLVTEIGTVPDEKAQFKITFLNKALLDVSMLKPLIDKGKLARDLIEKAYDPNPEMSEEEVAARAEKDSKKAKRAGKF